jgi:lactoylglutathione lyase
MEGAPRATLTGADRVRAVRLIHTCYRITDPHRSVAFYEAPGLEKRREMPIRDEAINIFMGVPGEELPELELTHNCGVDNYELGTAYGHVALTVDDLDVTLEHLKEMGSSRRSPLIESTRAARGSASSGTPTATGSSCSSSGAEGAPLGRSPGSGRRRSLRLAGRDGGSDEERSKP